MKDGWSPKYSLNNGRASTGGTIMSLALRTPDHQHVSNLQVLSQ